MEVSHSGDDVQAETSTGSGRKVEIKIKTLDSQVYTCSVDQNISVPALKEHVATLTGVPVENQRLICRGKVLKDDHNLAVYNVDDGHTLHLVTRQVPPGGPSSSAGTASGRDEQGGEDASQGGPRRPAQISHSVVMGTFNVPDGGDGGLPDVNRIISSVLTSLGLANLAPASGGTNTAVVNNSSAPDTAPDSMSGAVPLPASDASNSAANPSISAASFSPIMLPGMGQQFRFLPQVIPDALTTITQYMNSLEQVLRNGDESTLQSSGIEASQSNTSPTNNISRPTPANLGALIRRTIELMNGQAREELGTLSSQLEGEENLTDATARGDVQTSALRNGVLLQHLGALLLELGRATLTLRMGTSHNDAAVNAGPAVFISPAGPNPMMVQPLPFQPASGFGTLNTANPAPQTPNATGEIPRNISIHIHANDNNPITGNPFQSVVLGQGAGVNNPAIRVPTVGNAGPAGSAPTPVPLAIAVPIAANGQPVTGEQQPGVRVVPVRAVVASLPSNFQGRSPGEFATAPSGLLHPLLARFQQLNSQQQNGAPAVAAHGISSTPVVVTPSSGIPQQAVNAVQPTIRAQVQVQAWVPDGQGGSRLLNNEEALRTLFTSSQSGIQNPVQDQSLSAAPNPAQSSAPSPAPSSAQVQPGQPDSNRREEPESSSGERNHIGSNQNESLVPEKDLGCVMEAPVNDGCGEEVQKEDQEKYSQSREASSSSEASADKAQQKDGSLSNAPAGLGLGGLQPLPSRVPKRPPRNAQNSQSTSSSTQQSQERDQLRPPTCSAVSQPTNNAPLFGDSGNNVDIGGMVSQLLGGGSSGGGSRDLEQSLGLSGGALGNMMGQMMQNPFMRNVVQQVVEQVGEGDHDEAFSQGNLDFNGLLQQMMPVVGQALSRAAPASAQDQVSNLLQGIGSRGRARPNLERSRDGQTAANSPNISSFIQQMMPVVAQALGGQQGSRSEPPSTGIQPNLNAAPIINGINQVEPQEAQVTNAACQIEASQQESSSVERSEIAPIPKRQKKQ